MAAETGGGRRRGPRAIPKPEDPPQGLLRQGNNFASLGHRTILALLGREANRVDKKVSYLQVLNSSDAKARSIDGLSKTEIEKKLTNCAKTWWEDYDEAVRKFEGQNVEAPAPAAVELSEEETLVAEVTKVLKENTADRSELFALFERIPEIKLTEAQLAGNITYVLLQRKLRDWLDAQHEEQTLAYSRTSGENDVDTLSRELQSRRGVVDDVSIPKEDIGSEISNALVTCPTHNPNHWRTHLKTTDWNVVLDHFADHASLILAAGHGPPERTLRLFRDIENLEEPVVDEFAGQGDKGNKIACHECGNCRSYMARFDSKKGTVARSAKNAGHSNYKKPAGEGGWVRTYMCERQIRKRLSDEEISTKKCTAICRSVARLCLEYNSDVANALDDVELRAYAEAAVELKHYNHAGLGLTRDMTPAIAASLRARRRNMWGESRQGAEHDNKPEVRDARVGPWERFATPRGGFMNYKPSVRPQQ